MALNKANKSFQEFTMLFNDFERFFTASMNGGAMFNRYIIGMANVTLKTHAMSHSRVKLATPLTIVALQSFLNRLVVDSPHQGRVDHSHDDTSEYGDGCGNEKRPRNNGGENGIGNACKKLRSDEPEDGPFCERILVDTLETLRN
jgi:hypothetical protein